MSDVNLPPPLRERMEREAQTYPRGPREINRNIDSFLAGVTALHKALLESAPEFDRKAAERASQDADPDSHAEFYAHIRGQEHMHAQLAPVEAALRADRDEHVRRAITQLEKAARLERELDSKELENARLRGEVERLNNEDDAVMRAANEQIKRLTAALERAKLYLGEESIEYVEKLERGDA